MEGFEWNALKNERLKRVRGVSFEELLGSRLIDIRNHPSRAGQEMMLFEYRGNIWVIPFVRSDGKVFLKTLYRNRKYTKMFERGTL